MNTFLKFIITIWLLFSALFIWVGCALIGLTLSFSNLSFMYNVTPFIGFAGVICIIKCVYDVVHSNPADYIVKKVESVLGKAKIQR